MLHGSMNCKILDSGRLAPVLASVLHPLGRISRVLASLILPCCICLGLLLRLNGFVNLSHAFDIIKHFRKPTQ